MEQGLACQGAGHAIADRLMDMRYYPSGNTQDEIALTRINASNLCGSVRDRSNHTRLSCRSIAIGLSAQTVQRVAMITLIKRLKGIGST